MPLYDTPCCSICAQPLDFGGGFVFDRSPREDGSDLVHPDCCSYMLHQKDKTKPFPIGAVLRHTCGNNACLNPAHLKTEYRWVN